MRRPEGRADGLCLAKILAKCFWEPALVPPSAPALSAYVIQSLVLQQLYFFSAGKDFLGLGCCGGELLNGDAVGGQDRIEDEASGVADFVAVRVGELADQPMGAEKAQLAADGAGAPALFGLVFRRGGVEERLKIPIAQAMDGELASVDGLQPSVILGIERMQSPEGLTVPADPALDGRSKLLESGAVVDAAKASQ